MTEPSAKVIADSVSPAGHRLTTLEVVMHRFVLAEFNTHRVFSRNSESSRAVPITKKLERFRSDPARPVFWAAERPGMAVVEELTGQDLLDAQEFLEDIQRYTTDRTQRYLDEHPEKGTRLHKGLINRPLEWALWHTVIASSTDFSNFFRQRCSKLAQPEIRAAAEAMQAALEASTPTSVGYGEWHAPYVGQDDMRALVECHGPEIALVIAKKLSVARCARVSYLTHDGKRDVEADLTLYNRLITADPEHASPLEHVATPNKNMTERGNFEGWDQLRHIVFGA